MSTPREFRPVPSPSTARGLLGIVFACILFFGAAVVGAIALGSSQVTYVIEQGTLVVTSGSFLDGSRTVPLGTVTETRIVSLRGAHRTRGTAAPGLCSGRWSYDNLGAVWQATNCSPRVVVVRASGEELPIVISPPDPEAFIAAMNARTEARVELPSGDHVLILRILPAVASLLMVVGAVLLLILFFAGPDRMRYIVTDGRLEVRTIFSRKSWPVGELRAKKHVPSSPVRMVGTGLPGYYTGLYRIDGATTRVYATDLKSGILIEGPARILLTPSDPDVFLVALRGAGASA
jgi:Bacterial PH domain